MYMQNIAMTWIDFEEIADDRPLWSRACERSGIGAENGAERAEN